MDYLDIAQNIVRGTKYYHKDTTFNEQSFIYKKTNEKLQDIIDILLNKDKILCVIGSGDQILNSLLTKPSIIDAFDISIFPKFFLELKIAAIKSLTLEEYISFFIDDIDISKEEYYDDLFYDKIFPYLKEQEKEFWQYLFDYNSWYDIYNSPLFSSEPVIKSYALEQNPYLSEYNYYKLRENLKKTKINYIQGNILNMDIKEAYDLIYLSNIIQYVNIEEYRRKIKHLSSISQGIIVTYIFGNIKKALNYFENTTYRKFNDNSSGILIHNYRRNK